MTAKLKGKRMSSIKVRERFLTSANFPTSPPPFLVGHSLKDPDTTFIDSLEQVLYIAPKDYFRSVLYIVLKPISA